MLGLVLLGFIALSTRMPFPGRSSTFSTIQSRKNSAAHALL
jgi:hypothetical protein